MKRSTTMAWVYGISFALHATLGSAVASIEPAKEQKPIKVRVIEPPQPKVDEPPPEIEPQPPVPPPPVAEAPKPKPSKAEPPAPEVAAPAPVAPVPTFGVAMSGGVGMGGTAVPVGNAHAPVREPTKRVAESRALTPPAARAPKDDGCAEPVGKPKPLSMPRPEYTAEARAAAIEGKVRLEITVDENGVVTNVRVIESLDPGLDAAAVTALRGATFEAATRCGNAVSSTFNLAIKFAL